MVLFCISQVILYFILKNFSENIQNNKGLIPFDLMFIKPYNYNYYYQFTQSLTNHGKNMYLFIHQVLDFFYALLNAVSISLTLYIVNNKSKLYYFPFLGMIFDYLENIFVIIMLSFESVYRFIPELSSAFSMLKNITITTELLILLVLSLKYFIFKVWLNKK